MGVADGIYMWRKLGIDSGEMSRALMRNCREKIAAGTEDVFKGGLGGVTNTLCMLVKVMVLMLARFNSALQASSVSSVMVSTTSTCYWWPLVPCPAEGEAIACMGKLT